MGRRYAVIMAGGSGTRLWPMSRAIRPKQLLRLTPDGQSLLQTSVRRLAGLFDPKDIYIIAAADHVGPIAEELPEVPRENLIGEPVGRDTANAVGLAAAVLAAKDPDGTMGVFTADHLIEPVEAFQKAVAAAFSVVEANPQSLATFGIRPSRPHTGLGYVHRGKSVGAASVPTYRVLGFREKPDTATAATYVASGEYYWNSGMFVWKAKTILEQLRQQLPENAQKLIDLGQSFGQDDWSERAAKIYPELKKISIDFAVMEKARDVVVVELDCRWADVGSWTELQNVTGVDTHGNAVLAASLAMLGCKNNVVISSDSSHLIAMIGVEDMIVVHTPDATLVCPKSESQRIKEMVGQLEKQYERKYT